MTETESIVIDPVAMNIVNRIAPGSQQSGTYRCVGGLLVEGKIEGDIEVTGGPLVLMPEGEITGSVRADGEAYLFGTISARSEQDPSELDIGGVVYLCETLQAKANITASAFRSYQGAQVEGHIRTCRRES